MARVPKRLTELQCFHAYNVVTVSAIAGMAASKGDRKGEPPFRLFREIWAAGWTTAFASALLNPTDVAKVRIQAEGATNAGEKVYSEFAQTARLIVRQEGLAALWTPGIVATCMRDLTYSGLRVGLYPAAKKAMYGDQEGDVGILAKISVGMVTGALGSSMCNPLDLVKIRAQGEAGRVGSDGLYATGLRTGHAPSFANTWHGLQSIAAREGVAGLYVGTTATTIRAAMGTGAQLAAYDHTKHVCRTNQWAEEGPGLHVFASVISGLAFATGAAPADIIKARVMQVGVC
jgi:hypothetical protein